MAPFVTVRVAVASAVYAIDRPYDYLVPERWAEAARPGMRVLAPFGRGNRRTEGFILERHEEQERRPLKAIAHLYDDGVGLDERGTALALWMCRQYFCTFFQAADAMLPPGIWSRTGPLYGRGETGPEEALARCGRSRPRQALLRALYEAEEPLTAGELGKRAGVDKPEPALRALAEAGLIRVSEPAPRERSARTVRMISPAMPEDQAETLLGTGELAARRRGVLHTAAQAGSLPERELCYLTGVQPGLVQRLVRLGVLRAEPVELYRPPALPKDEPVPRIVLSEAQNAAFEGLRALMDGTPHAALLYGVTGSGKTQVYIRLIREALDRGQGAILLVPEIALTPQMVWQFCLHFRGQVEVVHSALTAAQRLEAFRRIRAGKTRVVIGTRTAVFAPVAAPGVIILDEEQEHSYKSADSDPRYHARDVAKYRAAHENCLLVLGSATPSVETFHQSETGKLARFELPARFRDTPLPETILADLRGQLRGGDPSEISPTLRAELEKNLAAGEQSILFLNRRGSARMAVCVDCGYVPMCKNCSAALTYHQRNGRLMCHHCGYSEELPRVCPVCGGERLKLVGTGTQKVEEELHELLPGARVLRMDADTTNERQSHEKLLDQFAKGKADILLGTQMVAKGLDFAGVTLVGVLDADLSLYCGDYHAQERTFSLLTQVVGRAGRRDKPGRAVIQTYTPENPVILAAARQDYRAFYDYELESRRAIGAPPFCDLFVFTVSSPGQEEAQKSAAGLAELLNQAMAGPFADQRAPLLGPAPAAIARLNRRYRFTLSFRGHNGRRVREMISAVLTACDRAGLTRLSAVSADMNPLN
jgi:primosomal protein N' (replication factor Y)